MIKLETPIVPIYEDELLKGVIAVYDKRDDPTDNYSNALKKRGNDNVEIVGRSVIDSQDFTLMLLEDKESNLYSITGKMIESLETDLTGLPEISRFNELTNYGISLKQNAYG